MQRSGDRSDQKTPNTSNTRRFDSTALFWAKERFFWRDDHANLGGFRKETSAKWDDDAERRGSTRAMQGWHVPRSPQECRRAATTGLTVSIRWEGEGGMG